ncbi:hypothetical protein [Nostoc sp. JL23]|uniref:hypothetical protein n=1 Tax=Nostoc sp. JL23 TaxID=2815394 RepID=UPI001D3FB3C2|nr:hypothetical protein [Nostoc sp. JL23]MBN3875279.1 hypothetical protein [Nostoc sp. JL23]
MTHPIYTRDLLKNFSRSELHEVCDRLSLPHRRSIKDCINDILAAQPQLVAQAELEVEQPANLPQVNDTHFIGGFLLRCAQVNGDYAVVWDVHDEKNVVMGEVRMGWNTFWTHSMSLNTFATPQEAVVDLRQAVEAFVIEDEAVAFEKVADGRWEAMVNGVLVCVAAVKDGYKTSMTEDAVLTDYDTAIVESLLAVARHQLPGVKPEFEIFTTRLPNVFAVHSRKSGQRYEVYPDSNSCTCPHWLHRHEQEGFRDKHLDAVRAALQSGIPLLREPQTDTEKLIESFTNEFGWIGGGQVAQARVWLESRFGKDFKEAILSGEARNKALQQEEQMDKEMANW